MSTATSAIELEEQAFELLNSLADDYGAIDEGGNLARQIQDARTAPELQRIIRYLQATITTAQLNRAEAFGDPDPCDDDDGSVLTGAMHV